MNAGDGGCSSVISLLALVSLFHPVMLMAREAARPDAATIISRSVEVVKKDWQSAPRYNHYERDRLDDGTKTYDITMILGSPYSKLLAINGVPLSGEAKQKEQQKLDSAIAQRCSESKAERDKRIEAYQKSVQRNHHLTEGLTAAFVFKLLGERTVGARAVWLLDASPKPGYRPPDEETKVLTGMRGKLWVDKTSYEWVRVQAWVVNPVSIEGFLARVEPGTVFELARAPVPGGSWQPQHFSVKAQARILGFIDHRTHDDESYFNYRQNSPAAVSCPASVSGRE
ncbi:MAG TPA: hypothetical protein VG273_13580 [Bryobacteraceae bacterium]|jgi:hypothetical protein|nr:hypothetical protein [Bryobacteraceae bacterium]